MKKLFLFLFIGALIVSCNGYGGEKLSEDLAYIASQTTLKTSTLNGIKFGKFLSADDLAKLNQTSSSSETLETTTVPGPNGGQAIIGGQLNYACGISMRITILNSIQYNNFDYNDEIYLKKEDTVKTPVRIRLNGMCGLTIEANVNVLAGTGYFMMEFKDLKGIYTTVTNTATGEVIIANKPVYTYIKYNYNPKTEKETYIIIVNGKSLKYGDYKAYSEATLKNNYNKN